jgi:uncharacterized protein (TIGR03437 family)
MALLLSLLLAAGSDLTLSSHGAIWGSANSRIEMTLPGSRDLAGTDFAEARVNYITGSDPSKWLGAAAFSKIRYKDIYPGISIVYHRGRRDLEFDFIVAPGADWHRITMAFPGARRLLLNARGDALVGAATIHRPRVSQGHRTLDAHFVRDRRNRLHFGITGVDPRQGMVIDPVVSYATYLGGEDWDIPNAIAVDGSGNAYVAGQTYSAQFPVLKAFEGPRGGASKTSNGAASWTGASQGLTNPDVQGVAIASDGTLYAATFGGVFKSSDNGATWTAASSGLTSYYVNSVVAPPKSPGTLYAATRSATGGGVYVSTNAGATWKLAGLPGIDLFFVWADPATGAILAASILGTTAGAMLYRSTDGVTWTPVLSRTVKSLTFDPQTPGTAYVVFIDPGAIGYAKSVDSGVTWTLIGTPVGSGPQPQALAAAGGGVLYAGGNGILQKSIDGGVTWTTLTVPGSLYDALAIDPITPSTLYAGSAVNTLTSVGGIIKSADAGATWTSVSTGLVSNNVYSLTIDPRNTSVIYASTRAVGKAFVTKYDPTGSLLYSTYLGGAATDAAMGIAVDSVGNAYITGFTTSSDFPTTPGAPQRTLAATGNALENFSGSADAFVTKLDTNGALVYSTLLGGTGDDVAKAIAVDSSGNVAITGATASPDFPLLNAFQTALRGPFQYPSNVFVAKLNSSGTAWIFSSYLGSDQDAGNGVALDGAGNVYVAGSTSPNTPSTFPQLNPLPAASQPSTPTGGFVAKFSPTGTLMYSTPFGQGNAIAADSAGNAYVTGFAGQGFPLVNPAQSTGRGFLSKIAPDGSKLLYSTLVGVSQTGSGFQAWSGVGIDSAGGAYVTGNIDRNDMPVVDAIQVSLHGSQDAFVFAVDPSGSKVVYSTYYGSTDTDSSAAIAVTALGTVYITGQTYSPAFPVTSGAAQPGFGGYIDGWVAKILPTPGGTPTLNPAIKGVQSAAGSSSRAAGPAGSLISIFGTDLAATTAGAPSLPLPTTLAGVTVTMNGIAIPLLFVSPGQINAQVPWELAGQTSATMTVTNIGGTSPASSVPLQASYPAIFPVGPDGFGAILIAGTSILAAPVGTFPGSRPAQRGEYVEVFCTGFGPVSNQPATGTAALLSPLSMTTATVTAGVGNAGGVPAIVPFAGLAPGFVGVYQINVLIPANAVSGVQNINLTLNGQTAILGIAVQ